MQVVALVFSLIVSLSVHAQSLDFEKTVARIQDDCEQIELCAKHDLNVKVVHDLDEGVSGIIDADVVTSLQGIARKQAHVWADTILEGDYFADRTIVLNSVEELQVNGRLLGYRISYSAKAWQTSTCNYDEGDLNTLRSCREGRISEKTFVSADFTSWLQDTHNYAEFY